MKFTLSTEVARKAALFTYPGRPFPFNNLRLIASEKWLQFLSFFSTFVIA